MTDDRYTVETTVIPGSGTFMIRHDSQNPKHPDFAWVPYKNNQRFHWRQAGDEGNDGSSIDDMIEELRRLRDTATESEDRDNKQNKNKRVEWKQKQMEISDIDWLLTL